MVARNDQTALPKGARPTAPALLDYFLEALAKRRDPQSPAAGSPDQSASAPAPAVSIQPDLFPK